MTSQVNLKHTVRQYRRRQVSVMIAQGMTEVSIAKKLGELQSLRILRR